MSNKNRISYLINLFQNLQKSQLLTLNVLNKSHAYNIERDAVKFLTQTQWTLIKLLLAYLGYTTKILAETLNEHDFQP